MPILNKRITTMFFFTYIEMYIKEVKTKACDGNATPTIVKETSSTAFVDARNGLGSVSAWMGTLANQ